MKTKPYVLLIVIACIAASFSAVGYAKGTSNNDGYSYQSPGLYVIGNTMSGIEDLYESRPTYSGMTIDLLSHAQVLPTMPKGVKVGLTRLTSAQGKDGTGYKLVLTGIPSIACEQWGKAPAIYGLPTSTTGQQHVTPFIVAQWENMKRVTNCKTGRIEVTVLRHGAVIPSAYTD